MTPRRPHKKSRNGCEQCKIRRVKCDEGGPPCANCVIREIQCSYSHRATLSRNNRHSANASVSLGSNTHDNADITSPVSDRSISQPTGNPSVLQENKRLRELALMHHYCTKTYLTFCHQHGQPTELQERELWQVFTVKEALKHDFLLNASLSITSLHMSTIAEENASAVHIDDALEYYDRSCASFRDVLPQANHSNCHAIYACSLAYLILGIAIPQFSPDCEERRSAKEYVLTVMSLYRGSREILRMFERTLLSGPWGAFLAIKDQSVFPALDKSIQSAFDRLNAINNRTLVAAAPERHQSNAFIIDRLQQAQSRCIGGVDSALVGWLTNVSEDFATDLQQNELVATLILMHWAVFLDQPSHLWWALRSGKALVDEMSSSLEDLTPEEYQAVMWCRGQVGLLSNWSTSEGVHTYDAVHDVE